MKRWKPETVTIVLSLVLVSFAIGYFTGRSTILPSESASAAVVTAARAPQAERAERAPSAPENSVQTGTAPPVPQTGTTDGRIDLNTASPDALCTLPGIGETLAGRIVAYREANGPFRTTNDLMNVAGIGEKKFSALQELVKAEE